MQFLLRWLLNGLYAATGAMLLIVLLVQRWTSGKRRSGWKERITGRVEVPGNTTAAKRLLIHAVSVGEVNAIRQLVAELEAGDTPPHIVISTTTDTGLERARTLFAAKHTVVRYPLDFSWAVAAFLNRVRPDAVALVELEVWPTFSAICAQRGIALAIINGRLSARSHARYRIVRHFVRPAFRRVTVAAVQDQHYRSRFADMGVAADRIRVLPTMKWDAISTEVDQARADALAADMGIDRSRPLVVAGSTAPEEHQLLHDAIPDDVQLLCAPRQKEWFAEAASTLGDATRRSTGKKGASANRFVLDTIGELRLAYALADVVIVGRSFGERHGSDMMEPVALRRATVIGPRVGDFETPARILLNANGLIQTTATELPATIAALLADPSARDALAARGLAALKEQQGGSRRHAELLLDLLGSA